MPIKREAKHDVASEPDFKEWQRHIDSAFRFSDASALLSTGLTSGTAEIVLKAIPRMALVRLFEPTLTVF